MKKKFLSIFLALAACLALLSTAALADTPAPGGSTAEAPLLRTGSCTHDRVSLTEDGKCGNCKELIVAQRVVDNRTLYYSSLDAALAAVEDTSASDNATIQLLQDVDLSGEDKTLPTFPSGAYTLDLNGHTLKGKWNNSAPAPMTLGSGIALTLQDSGASKGALDQVGFTVNSGGKLNATGVTFKNNSKLICAADNSGNGNAMKLTNCTFDGNDTLLTVDGGSVTLDGVTVKSTNQVNFYVNGGTLNIASSKL